MEDLNTKSDKINTSSWLSSTLEFLKEVENDGDTGDWVAKMFPVTYTLDNSEPNEDQEQEIDGNPKMTIFEQLAQRLSPLDEKALRNVYEKVWLMMHVKEKEKLQRQVEDETAKDGTSTAKDVPRNSSHPTENIGTAEHTLTSGVNQINITDPAIWNSREIEILRETFKKTKEENHELQAEIRMLKHDINKINKKHRRLTSTCESRMEKLTSAVKANERLKIAVDSLKKELKMVEASIEFLHDQLGKELNEKNNLSKEVQNLKLEQDREKLSRLKTEQDLQECEDKFRRKIEISKDRLNSRHQIQIDKLHKEMEELRTELQNERQNHQRSERALNHLRTHFASTNLQVETSSVPGPVTKDQLNKWTY